jgi:copper chaperone CopZ
MPAPTCGWRPRHRRVHWAQQPLKKRESLALSLPHLKENMSTITYPLTGLHCNACVGRVAAQLQPLAEAVAVTLNPMQVTLTNPVADFSQLQGAVANAGSYVLMPNQAAAQVMSAPAAMNNIAATSEDESAFGLTTYKPLLLIVAFILGASVLVQAGLGTAVDITAMQTMRYFMAGFFIVFSFFKLLDIPAFATAYSGYDLLAARWQGWGYVYPFVELALGIAYLVNFNPLLTNWATVIVMGFSAIGVIRAVMNKTRIQCACLGTVFRLPMSTVTIVEDVGMVAMALWMLVMVV